jgi:hypothetical protein
MSNVGTAAVTGPAIQVGTPDVVTGNDIFSPFDFLFSTVGVDVTVLMSDGHGALIAAAGSPVQVSPTYGASVNVGVSLGDMNGDGKLDIVTTSPLNDLVFVYLGDGHGGFTAGAVAVVASRPWTLALADLNNDGRLDIVTGNLGASTLSVLLADNSFGGYAAPISIPAGLQPISLALGDLNGDGTVDIIAGNASGGGGPASVTVALNDGHGGFSTATVQVVQDPVSVALGDLNGDGHFDLVVSSGLSAGTVDVLLGDGLGGFARVPGAPFATGHSPDGVALGDLNGDGLLDIVGANTGGSDLTVLFGNGDGTFTAQTPVAIGDAPRSVALADLNGDGMLDLVTNNYGGSVSVVLNDGHGGFGAAATTPINPAGFLEKPTSLALGNLDNVQTTAEDTDLLFGPTHNNAIRVSDPGAGGAIETLTLTVLHGTLTFTATANLSVVANAGSSSIQVTGTLADINTALDGLIYRPNHDYNGTDTLTLNLDNGAAQAASVLVPIEVTAVNDAPVLSNAIPDQSVAEDTAWSFQFAANAFTDPDGDAIAFTATRGNGDPLPAWLSFNAATRTFSGTPPANFNGPVDLKVTASDGTLPNFDTFTLTVTPVNDAPVLADLTNASYRPHGTPVTLSPALTLSDIDSATLVGATVHIAGGTFAGDGDVLAASVAGTAIAASYNAATETLTLSGTDTLAHYQQVLASVTFASTGANPGDTGAHPTRTVTWQVDDGGATHNLSNVETTTIDIGRSLASSFGNTGHSGILWQNADGTPAIWLLDGTTLNAGANVGFNPGTSWHAIGTGDFNGDGNADILWQNNNGQAAVWLMNGTSILSGANVGFNPGPAWHVVGSGDFDGDGKADILWQNTSGRSAVWLMDGLALKSGSDVGANPGASWHAIGSGDFNGDGKADILWQNNSGRSAVWLMDGLALKSGSDVGANPGASWHAIGSGDFNGDGKADILWQNSNGQAAVWLMDGRTLLSGANVGLNPGSDWHVQAAGDFNGDGKADILWQNHNGQAAVWMMNGQNLISGSNVGFNPGTSWQVHGTGDFNGDGKADIQWQNTDGTPAVWLMDGYNVVAGSNVGFDPGPNWHVIPPHHDALV